MSPTNSAEKAKKRGVPLGIVSDGGSDLKRAMDFLHQDSPQIRHLLDIKHKNALLLKKELESDARWGAFVTRANQTKLSLTQTSLAFFNPPSLKTKARYMNLDTLVSWGEQAWGYPDRPGDLPGQPADRGKLRDKLGWLREYRGAPKAWSELLGIAQTAEEYVHQEGLQPLICKELEDRLKAVVTTASGRRFKDRLFEFLAGQVSPLSKGCVASFPGKSVLGVAGVERSEPPDEGWGQPATDHQPPTHLPGNLATHSKGERLIGSTEVLESIIGKHKRLQSSHSKGGMTAMLLRMGAMLGKRASDTIQQALETIRTEDVIRWCKETLGTTLQAQRKLALGATKMG